MSVDTPPTKRCCVICGHSDWRQPIPVWDSSWKSPGEYRLITCSKCGVRSLDPAPAKELLEAQYLALSVGRKAIKGGGFWNVLAKLKWRTRIVKPPHPGARLLDVGCGNGRYLQLQRAAGWEVYGLETDPGSAEIAGRILGKERVLRGDLAEASLAPGSFDMITLWHVIEHLHDPLQTAQIAKSLLKPDGRLVMETPNVASWEMTLFESMCAFVAAPRHLHMFDRVSMEVMLRTAGFHSIRQRHKILVPAILSQSLLNVIQRYLPGTFSLPVRTVMGLVLFPSLGLPFAVVSSLFRAGSVLHIEATAGDL